MANMFAFGSTQSSTENSRPSDAKKSVNAMLCTSGLEDGKPLRMDELGC